MNTQEYVDDFTYQKEMEKSKVIRINGLTLYYENNRTKRHVVREFQLKPIEKEEIIALRLGNDPIFLLKKDNTFCFTIIPYTMKFFGKNEIGNHLCADLGKECKRFSPKLFEDGGCEKVRDISFSNEQSSKYNNIIQYMDDSKRLEKYPFITVGFETFNTDCDAFVVCKCSNYEKIEPNKMVIIEKEHKNFAKLSNDII